MAVPLMPAAALINRDPQMESAMPTWHTRHLHPLGSDESMRA